MPSVPTDATHDHVLPNGTTIHLRRIRRDDEDRLLEMWGRVSAHSRRLRFHGHFELTKGNVKKFTDLHPDEQYALVATMGRGDDEQIVGVARWERDVDDATRAEYAALIEDQFQGRGIGTALLRHVAQAAMEAGVKRLTGDILAENSRMLALVRDLGLEHQASRHDTVVTADFELEMTEEFLRVVAEDERIAASAALHRFFNPERVAVVGASRDKTSIGGLVFDNLLQAGFSGVVYPVNVSAAYVQGVAAYASLTDCPAVPDMVLVCVPAKYVAGVLEEAGQLGVKAVCIISAGFGETDDAGRAAQDELLAIARSYGTRIIGPNCMGLLNGREDLRMNGTFSTILPPPGRLAFSSQSGALGLAVLEHADALGLGISTFVSIGNKADISGNDLLLYWENDPETDVVLMYMESFGNPRKFSRIARRVSRKKPIVVVKSGRTSAGVRAASSHTGALAAGDVAVDALFRQTGVIRTDTLEELFDVATLLSTQAAPKGPNVAILTNAGGPGILAADALESNGLSAPALSEATMAKLREVLPPAAGIGNPVDMIASASAEAYERCLEILGRADEIDAVFVIFIPAGTTEPADVAAGIVRGKEALGPDVPVISVFMNARDLPGGLASAGIPTFGFPEDAARALGRVAEYGQWVQRPVGHVVRPDDIDEDLGRSVVEAALTAATADGATKVLGSTHTTDALGDQEDRSHSAPERTEVWLSNADAEAILRAYGVPLAKSRIVTSAKAGAKAQEWIDAKVAVKVAAPIHKADVGGLRLGLDSPKAVAKAIEEIRESLIAHDLAEHADAYVVQEMVDDGIEMVVGVSHDPSFGPIVMTGMGGTLVELLKDVSVRITPLTDVDVDDMLDGLRMKPLLDGYRGDTPKDIEGLKDLLHRINAMVEDLPEIAELDLNPVFIRDDSVVCVDLRMKLAR